MPQTKTKKSKIELNEAYASEHRLKRFKKFHKETNQTKNFNRYIEFHKEVMRLKSELDEALLLSSSKKALRLTHSKIWDKYRSNNNNHDFPNLYHYEVEKVSDVLRELVIRATSALPRYEFELKDTNKTVSTDGVKVFTTIEDMHRSCHSYYEGDIDFEANILFNGKVYYPSKLEDCREVFRIIEEAESNLHSLFYKEEENGLSKD